MNELCNPFRVRAARPCNCLLRGPPNMEYPTCTTLEREEVDLPARVVGLGVDATAASAVIGNYQKTVIKFIM